MSRDIDLKDFSKFLGIIAPNVEAEVTNTIILCCQKVRSDIQDSMAKTERNMEKSYYTHNEKIPHHPSLPGNPPARDTGNLSNSIRYEVYAQPGSPYGVVGTTQQDPPYGEYMEYGTSKGGWGGKGVAPRPWLRPAMHKNSEWIRQSITRAVVKGMKEVSGLRGTEK